MRRDHQQIQTESDDEINMTPMLDIVFIMLIFFIVTAVFIKEAGIEVIRPEAETAAEKPRANILVAISQAGEVWIDKRNVDVSSVRAIVEQMKEENPQGSVVVQADQTSTSNVVLDVLDQIKEAGITNIAISTRQN